MFDLLGEKFIPIEAQRNIGKPSRDHFSRLKPAPSAWREVYIQIEVKRSIWRSVAEYLEALRIGVQRSIRKGPQD